MIIYVVVLLWVVMLAVAPPGSILNNKYTSRWITVSLLVLFTVYLLSDISRFMTGDMVIYIDEFLAFRSLSLSETLSKSPREPLYTVFVWIVSQLSSRPEFYIGAVWLVSNGLLIYGLRKMFARWQTLVVLLSFLNWSTHYAYLLNGIRQGLAMSILIVAICLLTASKARERRFLFFTCLVIAPLVHFSALAFSACLALLYFVNPSLKTLLVIWTGLVLLFLSGANGVIFKPLGSLFPSIDVYTSPASLARFSGVNRLDFLLFGGVWIPIGLFADRYMTIPNVQFKNLMKVYILFNAVFVCLGFIAFSNRIAAYCWILLPIVIWHLVLQLRPRYRTAATLATAAGFVVLGVVTGTIWRVF